MSARVLRWVIVGLLVVGGLAFLAVGANGPDDPSLKAADGPVSLNRTPFGDFGEIGFRIEGASAAATAARCALLAETAAQQGIGLMNRNDLGGYDGMLFKFSSDSSSQFFMKDTPLPLSIAFFDAAGQFVSTADMAPCIHMPSCPTYGAARPYRWALEVPQGALPRLAIGPGTRLVAGGACT
ncbi:MAG TPA: DUF192 domain-containing protein [Acidimicrobiales bacterium]|nr:DUF192 domain-containing protein [Acidimicrobiales bacterium]